jgi:murein DD-endopeptidase MepM/ murein hydrolase activator NlpD
LTTAGQNAGLSNDLIEQLTNIFAWDIDFATTLSQGDQFTVVYEEADNADNTSGAQIIAAEFVNRGRILTAIRYKNSEGNINFYSPEGKPMRKAFLSAPVDYLRISSGFSSHRKHPILNRIRAHKGIDYAARTGTPVKSAGDGEVVFLGNKGGYGQLLMIKHGDHYETVYAHLSNFRKGLETGSQVKQGDVIGYVGQTGLATGPHLHYEFRVDGAHQNPETLNMAHTLPLHGEVLADFKNQTITTLAQLNKTKAQSLFAKNQYSNN